MHTGQYQILNSEEKIRIVMKLIYLYNVTNLYLSAKY